MQNILNDYESKSTNRRGVEKSARTKRNINSCEGLPELSMERFNIIERLASGEEKKIGSALHIDGEMFVTNTYLKLAIGKT